MDTNTAEGLLSLLTANGVQRLPTSKAAHNLVNPIDIYRAYISEVLPTLIDPDVDPDLVYQAVQWTSTLQKGDLLFVVPRLRIKGVNPTELASVVASKWPTSPFFLQVNPVDISVQFFFAPQLLSRFLVPYILDRGSSYGQDLEAGLKDRDNRSAGQKKIIVEFSSPNIAKKFHAGHLRSTIIGAYIANLYASFGWDVIRLNYLGDWGKQFGLLAVGWKKFGSEESFQEDPLGHLLDVYVQISRLFKPEEDARQAAKDAKQDTAELESKGLFAERDAFFKAMEEREPEALSLWSRFRDVSISRYIETYARLNIRFDEYSGESQVSQDTIQKVEKLLSDRNVSEIENGALIVNFKKHGAPKLDVAILRNRKGTSTYILRDLAAALERWEKFHFDRMVYVVSTEQDTYLRQVFKTVELMGLTDLAQRLQHINFGRVQGMSTRRGNVQLLSDILDEGGNSMHDVMRANADKYAQIESPEVIADTLGISALMVQDMSGKRINNYPFEMARVTSFEGDTGPYLQYTHARLCSIKRKSGITEAQIRGADLSLLTEVHAIDLLRLMAQYPDVTSNMLKTLEPTNLLTYLFHLTHQLSSGYNILRVMGLEERSDLAHARAALYEAARQILSNGMRLLGLSPVERM